MPKSLPHGKPARRKSPLWFHASGQWCKKYRGQFYYFGTDQEEALRRYFAEWETIKAGGPRGPRPGVGYTVKELSNKFLTAKRRQVDTGELSSRMWSEYHQACESVVTTFGKGRSIATLRAADFGKLRASLAKTRGPFALAKQIQMIRTLFAFAYNSEYLEAPIRYGDQFDKPPRRVMRLEKTKAAPKLLDAAAVWKLLDKADPQLKAMILLGLNAAYGQSDCSTLERKAIAARPGWLEAPRQKSGIGRKARLWPETIAAIAAVEKVRPDPKDHADAGAVFLTIQGNRWVKFLDHGTEKRGSRNDSVGVQFRKLAKKAGVPLGFYSLRHTFQTIADGARDPIAVKVVMGHVDPSMSENYREEMSDERIEKVCEHVRKWLLAGKPKGERRR